MPNRAQRWILALFGVPLVLAALYPQWLARGVRAVGPEPPGDRVVGRAWVWSPPARLTADDLPGFQRPDHVAAGPDWQAWQEAVREDWAAALGDPEVDTERLAFEGGILLALIGSFVFALRGAHSDEKKRFAEQQAEPFA